MAWGVCTVERGGMNMGEMKKLDAAIRNGDNTVIVHEDGRKEHRYFAAGDAIRRYARGKRAKFAFRYDQKTGEFVQEWPLAKGGEE